MPIAIYESDEWTPATSPATAEACSQSVHALTAQWAANRSEHIRRRVHGLESQDVITVAKHALRNLNARWEFNADCVWEQSDVTDGGQLWFGVMLPKRCNISGYRVTMVGSHSTAPGTLPTVGLYSVAGGVLTQDSTTTHPGTTYDGDVTFGANALGIAYAHDGGAEYFLRVTGESGSNSATGLLLLRVEVLVSP